MNSLDVAECFGGAPKICCLTLSGAAPWCAHLLARMILTTIHLQSKQILIKGPCSLASFEGTAFEVKARALWNKDVPGDRVGDVLL